MAAIVALLGALLFFSTRSEDQPSNWPVSSDQILEKYLHQLNEGETCKDRLEAVNALGALRDPRAIPDLKKARRRMRGGTLGFNKKNANRCLRKQAQRVIDELEEL
jgi:hypothetical protein